MHSPKELLEQECENVRRLLNETLRFEYGSLETDEFYSECSSRLQLLCEQVGRVSEGDLKSLSAFSDALSHLSALITRIERSHLGEFSWPFANELQKLAVNVCRGTATDSSLLKEPHFFISADGGLAAYRIHAEQRTIDIIGRRIFNIVFPRSLKHHVLLHPILGHEIGHAAWSVPSIQHDLVNNVLRPLFEKSPLYRTADTVAWLQNTFGIATTEQEIQRPLASWAQEFLCDLYGLVLMGPSFVAAHQSLLLAVEPTAQGIGESHPPSACRFWMIREAARALKWDAASGTGNKEVDHALKAFWDEIDSQLAKLPSWAAVFDKGQVETATHKLSRILQALAGSCYIYPDIPQLSQLLEMLRDSVPPVGYSFDNTGAFAIPSIDFRNVLFGGWLAWNDRDALGIKIDFFELNRLCDHAILQQQGVAIWKAGRKPVTQSS